MKKLLLLLLIIIVIVLAVGGFFVYNALNPALKHVHYHAGFQVYVNGKQQDFSSFKYMFEEPCTLNGKEIAKAPDQIMKAHLHEQVGDIVHVHREPAYWSDLFTNIKYSIPQDAVGYINGKKVDDFLHTQIHPYDSLVVLIGTHGDVNHYLAREVTKKHIQDIEHHSEQCGTT